MLSLFRLTLIFASISGKAFAFAPNIQQQARYHSQQKGALSVGLDPSFLNSFDTLSISDAVDAVVDAAPDAAAAASANGWFGFLVEPIEALLEIIHSGLNSAGLGANSWGVSIILLTLLVKGATFPLTKTQLESTNKMQTLQPRVKELQNKYQSNPEVMNKKVSELYQETGVNPLAGCVPSIVQIPVFIGLYRSVLNLAKDDKLNEPFLWLPNLEGPTYGADPGSTYSWIMDWSTGAPPLGFGDTAKFLILPTVLIIGQFLQVELMQPKDVKERQDNPVTKVLPFMIGFFALGVPSALSIYWVINVFISTASSLYIKNSMPTPVALASPMASSTAAAQDATFFAPSKLGDTPSGFGSSTSSSNGVKPLTASAIDAEVVTSEDASEEVEVRREVQPGQFTSPNPTQSKKKGKKRKGKKRKNKN